LSKKDAVIFYIAYTCLRIRGLRIKKKTNASIRKDILDEGKKYDTSEGKKLSNIVEEYFEYFVL
jgi:hypothetical protein